MNCGTCVVISKPLRVFSERESGGKQKNKDKTKTFGKVFERTSAGSALAHATRHRSVKSALIRPDMYRQITFKHEGNSSLQKRSVSAHAPFYRGTEAILWLITVTTAPLKIPGGKSTNIKTIYFCHFTVQMSLYIMIKLPDTVSKKFNHKHISVARPH